MILVIIRIEFILGDLNLILLYKIIFIGGEDYIFFRFNIIILFYMYKLWVFLKIVILFFLENFVEKFYNSIFEFLFFKGLNRFLIVYEGFKS